MQHLNNPSLGDIVIVKRDDHGGYRIPMDCREYIHEGTYLYKARIVKLLPGKRYHKVIVIDWNSENVIPRNLIRKAYKSKIYSV